jgi:hypothetical protein
MSFEYTIYGDVRFELSYSDQELGDKVLSYIKSKESEESFTYLSLCRSLIESATEDKHLKGARDGVYYQSPQLKPSEYTRVSRILWKFILSGKVFVDFYNNEYVARDSGDTTFGIITDTEL